MGSGAVGLNPVGGPVRDLEDRHDHAALGKTSPVLMFVFRLDLSKITMLVTLERFSKGQVSLDGFRTRRDPDFSQKEKRGFFHGICGGSVVGRQEHGSDGTVVFSNDVKLHSVRAVINREEAQALFQG